MHRVLRRLALVWLLFVPLWMTWGVATYGGLYRWLCDWQLSVHGEYDAVLTFILPTLLLVAPTTLVLRLQGDAKPAVPPPPLEIAVAERLLIRVLGSVALSGTVVCAGAWLWALQYPDRSGASVDVDLAELGDAVPPLGRVTLVGAIDPAYVLHKTIDAKGIGGRYLYAPMIEPGSSHRPARFFVEQYVDVAVAQPLPAVARRFKGVMVEGGLPGDMQRQFARLHVGVADPYYLLLTDPAGARGNYYGIALLGGFVALVGLLPLVLVLLTRVSRRWRPS